MNRKSDKSILKALSWSVTAIMLLSSLLIIACEDKVVMEVNNPPEVKKKALRPLYPVALGTIRGYFNDEYKTFDLSNPVDTFSNVYFYGGCDNDINQVNLRRRDSAGMLEIYMSGYGLDTLPGSPPAPYGDGRSVSIQYSRAGFEFNKPGNFFMSNSYGRSLVITSIKDDILTGTFKGELHSVDERIIIVTHGEFKIRIFRKHLPCYRDTVR